jgi:uncharacterized membrane protein
MRTIYWFHIVSAAVWLGGLITLGALVGALRKAEVDRSVLQVMAKQFGRVSWAAMAVAVLTGAWMSMDFLGRPGLAAKFGAVMITAGLAAWHQFAARDQSPAVRGMLQGAILLASLATFVLAVAL